MDIKLLKRLEKLAEDCRREHHVCEDEWYSCPLSTAPTWRYEGSSNPECDCGADQHNAKIEEMLKIIRHEIESLEAE